jgi:zinc transporter, ZIP family
MSKILLFSFIPIMGMIIGGTIALYYPLAKTMRGIVLHFAAGVVFAVVTVEILPDILKNHHVWIIGGGFGVGVMLMLCIRFFTRHSEQKYKNESAGGIAKLPLGMLTGIAVDIFIDGLLIGIGFAAGAKEGILLTIALAIEIFSLGLAVSTQCRQEGLSKQTSLITFTTLSTFIFMGSFIGSLFYRFLHGNNLVFILSFGLAALLYLVTEELLCEAHQETDSPLITGTFFLGFIVFLLIGIF